MTEIPDDVRVELAKEYVRQNFESGEPWSMTIARAILAERERCEKRNRRGPCEHVWVGKPGPKIFGFREFNCIKCGLGKQES